MFTKAILVILVAIFALANFAKADTLLDQAEAAVVRFEEARNSNNGTAQAELNQVGLLREAILKVALLTEEVRTTVGLNGENSVVIKRMLGRIGTDLPDSVVATPLALPFTSARRIVNEYQKAIPAYHSLFSFVTGINLNSRLESGYCQAIIASLRSK